MKSILIVLFCSLFFYAQAQDCQHNKRKKRGTSFSKLKSAPGDSINVEHYQITIDSIINNAVKAIYADTELKLRATTNGVTHIDLSLLKLTIDSITSNGSTLPYTYNDTTIHITLPFTMNSGDSVTIAIYYHGKPLTDASGWGGFYFTTNHVFNLGVGFAADPHVYGRVWFPCIDTFDDKALYDFFIATDSTKKAFCNGMLLDSLLLPNGKRQWHWKMNHPIPTYLASMAVSGYKTYKQTIAGIPVEIAGQIADSNRIKNTFTHLPDVVNAYVDAYGPYPFDKIGYSLVPFNSGAMEHATQITIGSAFIDGTTTYETLWAHELAHMYWGDMATCKTAEDMWLNEGWASFNEAYMTEKVYGLQAYKDHVSATHKYVLQFSHIDDGSYLTMNNIPHAYTYGTTVYRKGADLAHTLRHYLGDSLFKIGAKYYFNNRAYGNASSADFRDDLTTATGVDMTRFFNDWVFTPGFPHFSIDSVVFVPGGLDHYFVYTRQRSKGNNHIYNMPVDITLSNGVDDTTYTIVIDSATNSFHIATLGVFDHFMLDLNEKISDAMTDDLVIIDTIKTISLPETFTFISALNVPTPKNKIRIEHNWVAADPFKKSNPGIRISNYRYWNVVGKLQNDFHGTLRFNYDGRTVNGAGYLDNTLISATEDSLVLLYRKSVADDWQVIPHTINFNGSHIDKAGTITTDSIRLGEYALGYYDYTVSIATPIKKPDYKLTVSPNPGKGEVSVSFAIESARSAEIIICDSNGRQVFATKIFPHQEMIKWDAGNCSIGKYLITLVINGQTAQTEKFILTR